MAEKVLAIDQKDTYDRTDNYNVYGVFCFFALRLRTAFFKWTGTAVPADGEDSNASQALVTGSFHSPNAHDFTYELYHPLLAICMRSKSQTIKSMAHELTDCFAYLLSPSAQAPSIYDNLAVYQTDVEVPKQIFAQLFSHLGE